MAPRNNEQEHEAMGGWEGRRRETAIISAWNGMKRREKGDYFAY